MEVFERRVLRRYDDPDAALDHARRARKPLGPQVIVEKHHRATVRPYRVVALTPLDLDSDDGEGLSE